MNRPQVKIQHVLSAIQREAERQAAKAAFAGWFPCKPRPTRAITPWSSTKLRASKR